MRPRCAAALGTRREVTDEVIEYDASLPGYKGRRVVQFRRLDGRTKTLPSTEGVGATTSINFVGFAAPNKAAA